MMDGALFCCVVSGFSLILFCGLAYAVTGWFLETQQGLCACGLADAAIGALPTFAYEAPREAEGGGDGDGDEDSGEPHVSSALCAVCLEDVQAGELVRQLPACRHLFHADCIDAWVHAHRTCPLCRCKLPQRKATAKAPADVLPPV